VAAQAFVKGWLFYHDSNIAAGIPSGVAADHCRGFWCAQSEMETLQGERYVILPRLRWLPPVRMRADQCLSKSALHETLDAHFAGDSMPVLVALVRSDGDAVVEADRGFIVPDDWHSRAGLRARKASAEA
jgi:hypothetical protein